MNKLDAYISDYWVLCDNKYADRCTRLHQQCKIEVRYSARAGRNGISGISHGSTTGSHISGTSGASTSGSRTLRMVPLTQHILKLKQSDKWLEKVPLPRLLKKSSEPASFCVILGDGGREVLMLILQCIERVHASGNAYASAFTISNMYYLPDYNVIEIDVPTTKMDCKDWYEQNMASAANVIVSHFLFIGTLGLKDYPMHLEDLLTRIGQLGDKRNRNIYLSVSRRSLIFNHPATMQICRLAAIFTNLLLKYNSFADKGLFLSCLNGGYDSKIRTWCKDVDGADAAPEMKRIFNYQVKDPVTQVYRNKVYQTTVFGRLDFSRCFITHGLKLNVNFSISSFFTFVSSKLLDLLLTGIF